MNGIQEIMDRIRQLKEYEVQLTVPDNFRFTGPVPFDMNIVGGQAFVRVVASSYEEALARAKTFFETDQEL